MKNKNTNYEYLIQGIYHLKKTLMEGFIVKKLLLIIFTAILSSCSIDQIAKLEINNVSGYDVNNITFKYTSSDGDNQLNINEIGNNSKYNKHIKIAETVWGLGGSSYAAGFSIEYYINSQYFCIINDIDVQRTSDGSYYNNNASLCDGKKTIINICDYGYQIINE
jgi:hypothetical protein